MPKEREVFLNGGYRPWGEATVHLMSHSFGRGSAIFEVIGFDETPAGPAVFRLDEYLARFRRSASLLGMELPLAPEALQEAILLLVKRSGLKNGFIKLFGFYPEISFSILPSQPRIEVAACLLASEEVFADPKEKGPSGVTACLSRWRRLDPQTVPIEAKVAANYVSGMVARNESRKRGFDYALLLDTQGFVAEGGTESLFLVKEGVLMTPSLGTVLESITRKSLLEVAQAMGMDTHTGRLDPRLLDEAEEIFFAGTVGKVLPVRQIGDRSMGAVPGPVARRLAERMAAITAGRDVAFARWLFPCS
ncbi:MAG: aminotransferase class IV [Deltaproteobacteria bacterium]|nr:aminotransferase class IV [Deltaproteobacteria bacterium]